MEPMATAGLPDTATSHNGDLELSIAARRANLRVSLANRSAGTLCIYFAVDGPNARHHDHLIAWLARGDVTRELRFYGPRNRSGIGKVELEPGQCVADDIDLHAWAREPVNGGEPLEPGEYALTAVYQLSRPGAWSGSITAGPIRLAVE